MTASVLFITFAVMDMIVDCGSTKCRWTVIGPGIRRAFDSPGFNPALLDTPEIESTFADRVPQGLESMMFEQVWIYAAGCRSEREENALRAAAQKLWRSAAVTAASDVLGAARAVCGTDSGIACILGTGSNCAIYSPKHGLVRSTPPLGFILGDEGSGADIGKALVNHVLKRRWNSDLVSDFLDSQQLTADIIINKVYRCPEPNRFLASLTHWAADNIHRPEVDYLVVERFQAFIARNIRTLSPPRHLKAGFVGSVAKIFEPQLIAAAEKESLPVGKIEKSPENGLIAFHCHKT